MDRVSLFSHSPFLVSKRRTNSSSSLYPTLSAAPVVRQNRSLKKSTTSSRQETGCSRGNLSKLPESIWRKIKKYSKRSPFFSNKFLKLLSSSKFSFLIFLSDGAIHGFENGLSSFPRFLFNIQRLLSPLHALKNEEEVEEFFADSGKVFSKEYMTPLFKKSKDQEKLKGEITEEFEGILQ